MAKRMVKLSTCPKCKNMVAVAIPDKTSKQFWKDVNKYQLNVEDMTLDKFNKSNYGFCKCK